jgi:hypothetical protein
MIIDILFLFRINAAAVNTEYNMQVIIFLPVTLLAIVMVLVDSKHNLKEEDSHDQEYKSKNKGSGRVFPLLPPYQGVDFGANFNKLKSSGDAGYFVVRDSIVVSWGEDIKFTNTTRKTKQKLALFYC